jgi:hypothetical protein
VSRYENEAQEIDGRRNDMDSLDIEIYDLVIIQFGASSGARGSCREGC